MPSQAGASQTETAESEGAEGLCPGTDAAVEILEGAQGAPLCCIYFDVVEELLFAADWKDEPCCAALTGRHGDRRGEDGQPRRSVEITGFSGLSYAGVVSALLDCGRTALRRLAPPSLKENRENEAHSGTGSAAVGLFVSVPGGGARLDLEMARLHMSLLNGPDRLLIVADPVERRLAVYTRSPGRGFERAAAAVVYQAGAPRDAQRERGSAGEPAADEDIDEYSEVTIDDRGDDDGDADAESEDERPDRPDRSAGDSG